MGEFLAGEDLNRPATLMRRASIAVLAAGMITTVAVAILGVDDILEHFGLTRPSLALRAHALNALDSSEAAHAVLGSPILPDTSGKVKRQALMRMHADQKVRVAVAFGRRCLFFFPLIFLLT